MSQKKSTTPKRATSKRTTKQPTRAELRAQLARDIANIFRNPETPVPLYNGLAEIMNDLYNAIPTKRLDESEDYNLMLLDEYAMAQEGGAR